MTLSTRLTLAALALSLLALTLDDPAASSRPVRAEAAIEAKLVRFARL